MKAIKFNTGRQYTPQGQLVVAYQVGEPEKGDIFGCEWLTVRFIDVSRMVSGEIAVLGLTENHVMAAYDGGHYESVWIDSAEKAQAFSLVNLDADGIPL